MRMPALSKQSARARYIVGKYCGEVRFFKPIG
jgi:hypothetical protein